MSSQKSQSKPRNSTKISRESNLETIEIEEIRRDGGTQPRARLDEDTISVYVENLLEGSAFPPVKIFYDGENYWLADGFHRVKAHEEAKIATIQAEITPGTRRDAILYCVGANADHGLRRSNADKRRAVETLFSDSEWQAWSDRQIAAQCRVSSAFVGQLRRTLATAADTEDSDQPIKTQTRIVQRGGQTYTVNTTNIGKKNKPDSEIRERKKKPLTANAPNPLVVKARKVKKNEIWELGGRHLLFCGDHSSMKFQDLLPEEIPLLFVFPTEPNEWLPSIPNNARSILALYSNYNDIHLETIRNIVSNFVSGATDAEDSVVMLGLPDSSLFLLMEDMDCRCICGEPDPSRCTEALTAWTVTKLSAKNL